MSKETWKQAQEFELRYWERQNMKANKRSLTFIWEHFFSLPTIFFKDDNILEIGTGPVGFVSIIEAKHKIGLEPLKTKLEKIFILPEDVEWIDGKAERIPLKDNSLDAVLAFNVWPSHVDDPETVLDEIKRIMKPGGVFLFGMKFDQRDRFHIHILCRRDVKVLISKQFTIEKEIEKYGLYGLYCRK